MDEDQRDFLEDGEQIEEAVNRFRQAFAEGRMAYFDVFEYEGIIDYLMEEGETELASAALSGALEMHPNSVDIKLKHVQLQLFNNELIPAFELIAELEKMEPDNEDLLMLKGMAYVQSKQVEKAIDIYNKLREQTGEADSDLSYDIALGLQQAGRFEEAIYFLNEVYLESLNYSLLYELGYCYSQIEQYEKGVEYYLMYLDDDPLNAAVWYNLGINYNLLDEFQKSIDAYDNAIALQDDLDQAYFNKGNVLANLQRFEEAIESYGEYLQLQPDSEEGHLYIADCYLSESQYKEACLHYKEAFDLNSKNLDALHSIAIALTSDDRNESALKVMQELLSFDANNAGYLNTLASIYWELDRNDEAHETYQKALLIDENCVAAWGGFSDFIAITIGLEEALEVIEEALACNPDDYFLLTKKIVLYADSDMCDEAVATTLYALGLRQEGREQFARVLRVVMEELDSYVEISQQVIQLLDRALDTDL